MKNIAGICFCVLVFLFLVSAGTFCLQQEAKENTARLAHKTVKRTAVKPRPVFVIDSAFEGRINRRIDSIGNALMIAVNKHVAAPVHARRRKPRKLIAPEYSPFDIIPYDQSTDSILRKHFHIKQDTPALIFKSTK